MKIFARGADRRRRREKLGILAVFTTKFNVFTEKKQLTGTGTTFLTGTGMPGSALKVGTALLQAK